MPTSPRDLTGRTGGMIRINHPLWPRTFRADVGIRPYAGGRFLPRNLARPILSCVPSTPAAYGRHPLQAGEGRDFLRRGRSLTFPWGKVPPQRRMRGGTRSVLPTAPLPSGLRPATLSQERVWPLIRPGLRPVHLKRRGRLPPAEESKGTPPPGRGRRLRSWRTWGRWGYSLRRRRRK